MELSSTLSLDMFGKPFLLGKRIELLYAIAEHGSISKAAKAVPMSYKSAWEAVDVMNNLASEPIVVRETGGKNGGGTTITRYGQKLLDTYTQLKLEHDHFLERLSQLSDLEHGTIKTIERFSMQLSARNQLQGKVLNVETDGVNAQVTLQFGYGKELFAIVTNEAVETMQIRVGEDITAIFKSNSVELGTDCKEMLPNCWKGKVQQIQEGKEHCKVTVEIGGQRSMVSVVSRLRAESLQLGVGKEVSLSIQANEIILGR
jgi:molybdate transport system regulatory protein